MCMCVYIYIYTYIYIYIYMCITITGDPQRGPGVPVALPAQARDARPGAGLRREALHRLEHRVPVLADVAADGEQPAPRVERWGAPPAVRAVRARRRLVGRPVEGLLLDGVQAPPPRICIYLYLYLSLSLSIYIYIYLSSPEGGGRQAGARSWRRPGAHYYYHHHHYYY